jgi:hypothetical protein
VPKFPGFCGPSNTQASRTVDAELTVNVYMRIVDAGSPKAGGSLYKAPGLAPFAYLGNGPVRASFAQDGRCTGVGGNTFYEVLPSGNVTAYNSLPLKTNGNPATISSSGAQGHQQFITSGGEGYIFDTNAYTLTPIFDSDFPSECVQGLFFKGYFWALSGADGRVQSSKQYNGLIWNSLDFVIESDFSDQVIAIARTHDNLWLFGTRNTAPWAFTGEGNQSIVPIQGAIIEHGCGAAFSVVSLDNTLYWLGRDENGSGIVWRASGYTPVRISTHAVEAALAEVSEYGQAVAWAYQEQGHTFYVLYVPGLETSWVYDIATQQWHERGHWSAELGRYRPYRGMNHCYAFGRHLVGDRESGALYTQSMDILNNTVVAA